MKVIAVMNYKGGVGKTTFTGCIAQALALTGFRVLAVDNDGQHDLSTLLGVTLEKPTVRDIYHAAIGPAAQRLMKAIRETDLPYLHVVASENDLCNADVSDPYLLKKCFSYAMLHRFYDYVLIDNAPGMDALQLASMHAADEIFVPAELKQFSMNGIRDMDTVIRRRYPDAAGITRIIPLFYRDTKSQNAHWDKLREEFPGRVVETPIPYDNVFDELVSEGRNLYLHRLSSRGAAYYLKLMHELFGLQEESTWQMVMDKRKRRRSDEARRRVRRRAAAARQEQEPSTQSAPSPAPEQAGGSSQADEHVAAETARLPEHDA